MLVINMPNNMPIHIKSSKSQAINYRPVSLTSFVRKLMEAIAKNHITLFLSEERLLGRKQSVFLSRKNQQ